MEITDNTNNKKSINILSVYLIFGENVLSTKKFIGYKPTWDFFVCDTNKLLMHIPLVGES